VAPVDVLYFPLPQSWQVAADIAPVDVLYFPLPQSSQVAAPVDVPYFPLPQSLQLVAPVDVLYFPAEQEIQEDSFVIPLMVLNLPAGHARQAELEAPPVGL
jgi:hypothetical protein